MIIIPRRTSSKSVCVHLPLLAAYVSGICTDAIKEKSKRRRGARTGLGSQAPTWVPTYEENASSSFVVYCLHNVLYRGNLSPLVCVLLYFPRI